MPNLTRKLFGAVMGAIGVAIASLIFSLPLAATVGVVVGPVAAMIVPAALIVALIWGADAGWKLADIRQQYTMLQCAECGYSLRGSKGDTCPECGFKIDEDRKRYRNSRLYGLDSESAQTHQPGE